MKINQSDVDSWPLTVKGHRSGAVVLRCALCEDRTGTRFVWAITGAMTAGELRETVTRHIEMCESVRATEARSRTASRPPNA